MIIIAAYGIVELEIRHASRDKLLALMAISYFHFLIDLFYQCIMLFKIDLNVEHE